MSEDAERLALERLLYDANMGVMPEARRRERWADLTLLESALDARDAELADTDARAQNAEAELMVAREELARLHGSRDADYAARDQDMFLSLKAELARLRVRVEALEMFVRGSLGEMVQAFDQTGQWPPLSPDRVDQGLALLAPAANTGGRDDK